MSKKDGTGVCYEWQKESTQFWQWAKEFKELQKTGLRLIWHYWCGRNKKKICKMIKIRCRDIQRQMALANVQGKTSMVIYCEIKVGGCREECIVHCNGNERSWLGWFQMGWVKRGTCSLCRGEESAFHILLNYHETQRWKKEFLGIKWFTN